MRRIVSARLWAGLGVGLIVLYILAGFFLLPYLFTTYGIQAAANYLKCSVAVREVAFNPLTLALRLKGLEVRESDQMPIIGLEELVVDLRAISLFGQKLSFDQIRLTMPFVSAKVNREGKINLLALVPAPEGMAGTPSSPPAGAPKKPLPVEIGLLEISKGIVEYRDESKPRPVVMDIVPIQITLRNFSTLQRSDNAYTLTAEIGKGESLMWEGTVSLDPLESDGKVILSGVKVRTLYQAVQDRFRFDVQEGEITLSALYHVDLRGQAPRMSVKEGRLAVRNLSIGEREFPDPLVTIPAFEIEGFKFDLEQHTVEIDAIRSADAHIEAWVDSGGTVNLLQLLAPAIEERPSPAPALQVSAEGDLPGRPWSVFIGEVALQNYGSIFEDRTLARPVYVDVDHLNLTVKEVRLPFKQVMPIDLSMTLNKTGSIAAKGWVAVDPLSAELDVQLTEIGIRPFQAYLDRFVNLDVRDGAIDLAGTVRYAVKHFKEPLLRFQGQVAVNRLSIADRTEFEEMVSWRSLAMNRVVLDVEPTAVKIAEIVWQEPAVQAVIDADGVLNFSNILGPSLPEEVHQETVGEGGRREGAKPASPRVTIDQVRLIKAGATFRDLSIQPSVKVSITDLSGAIRGLSSKQINKADMDLAGQVNKTALLKISGKINPLSEDVFTDIVLTLEGMDLTPVSPYSAKYAGYRLVKGKLSLDLKYKISQKLLEAENLVVVDQLAFGAKVESPDATSLPVPLLVALLQDRNGVIEIDLPIRGDLNDPDFQYGKVVVSTLVNVLGKIVASPFTLLGKLVPGGHGGDDLQFIAFQPGSASLMVEEATKLEAVEKVLAERPALRLEIRGTADPVLDRAALRLRKLKERLLAMKRQEFWSSGKAQELSAEDEQRLVKELFAERKMKRADLREKPVDTGEQDAPSLEEMRRQVAAEIPVTEADLESLARQRGEVVRDWLLERGTLESDRLFLLEINTAESGHELVRAQLGVTGGS